MKKYIKYLKCNPSRIVTIILVMSFCAVINIVVNNNIDFNPWLSIAVAIFSIMLTILINLQVWGEYKGIEGLKETIRRLFYGL